MHEATVAARGLAESASLEEAETSRLAIVIEELVTNLYDHGGLDAAAEFIIELSITDDQITLVLTDPGAPFDPSFARLESAIPARGGGAGLKLVRAWAIHTEYEAAEGVNCLRVRFPRRGGRT